MSWSLILNSTTHTLPDSGEEGWSAAVNAYLLDVCSVVSGTWQTVTVTGPATTVDFNNGKNIRLLLGANTAITFTNPRAGKPVFFKVKNTGAYAVTWPSNVLWSGGTEPTNTSGNGKVDTFAFVYDNTDLDYLGESSLDMR